MINLEVRKLKLIEEFLKISDVKSIEKIEAILKKRKIDDSQDYWDELPQNIKDIIDKGILESRSEEVVSFEKVVAEAKSKYKIK